MRWSNQAVAAPPPEDGALPGLALSDLAAVPGHLRTVRTPEFAGLVFHEVLAKSALNRVPGGSSMPFSWTINPYRGCSHACVYCFARGSHRYLDFDTGRDFDSQIVVKVNVAEVLGRELGRPGWARETVALGTNTDPYQRAEGRYRLMPGIIAALQRSGTPLSILTKGTLIRRDLPLLVDAAERVSVDVSMSIAIRDGDLQRSIEPGVPGTRARLETIAAAADAGLAPNVFLMPVLPFLSDAPSDLDALLADIRAAGARSVMYGPLHLRSHVKPWFFAWLEHTHPDLVPRYRALYAGPGGKAESAYRKVLAARIRPLIRKHGLEMPRTGGPAASGAVSAAGAHTGPPQELLQRVEAERATAVSLPGLESDPELERLRIERAGAAARKAGQMTLF
ncbi:Rv2578c family radical SAM protein [Leucobacter sp. CSA2]|uniref:Rv2578c family radical SAM protein n=1 Tax=Leucobacter edaphi TaxID=2796472 RepID=A0A934UXZ5_9MICO|nr:Rv2578c family radical SAM protein [Leucobacter edaphi]MBK0422166.1 Rv2578c family radical SAM protein [Leucobacter edaphi]